MKKLFLSLLFFTNIHAMNRSKHNAPKAIRSIMLTTDPTSLSDLSRDLKVAIREIDLAKTQATLILIGALQKKSEELRCLEVEVSAQVNALKFHHEKISKYTAKWAAKVQVENLISNSNLNNTIFPSASQAAILNHAYATAIHDAVNDFFREQWQFSQCNFTLTPPPPNASLHF